jgi:1-acyl-sn-glycerol-3-phosphate acyltransferase
MAGIHALTGQQLAGQYNEAPPAGALNKIADKVFPRERF